MSLIDFLKVIIWPITIIVITLILRQPISESILKLKKAKYKDLELEFEKDSITILYQTDRDLPQPKEHVDINNNIEKLNENIRFSKVSIETELDPKQQISEAWNSLEYLINNFSNEPEFKNTPLRLRLKTLKDKQIIIDEVFELTLKLSLLRNRIAHYQNDITISKTTALSFTKAVNSITYQLNSENKI